MSTPKSRDAATAEPSRELEHGSELQGSGIGALSALQRMKAEHALRHRRQHGTRTAGPGHEEDESPQR